MLGVDSAADRMTIKAAFRRLALRHHPDRAGTGRAARRRFQQIREAYDVLSDPDRRREYDSVSRARTALRPVARGDRRTNRSPGRPSVAGIGITVALLGLKLGVAVNAGAARTPGSRNRRKT